MRHAGRRTGAYGRRHQAEITMTGKRPLLVIAAGAAVLEPMRQAVPQRCGLRHGQQQHEAEQPGDAEPNGGAGFE